MPKLDIIVIGASAGGIEALTKIVERLALGLEAAVFIVLHVSPHADSFLPQIMERVGELPAMHAIDRLAIQPGQIYIAPPDHHLLVERGYMRVTRGPRENRGRPAIDPLFRSAALAYGPQVIGVILSGMLDDGTSGLYTVAERGGTTVVQEPTDALHPSMPRSALEYVRVDYCLPAAEIGPLLVRLVDSRMHGEGDGMTDELAHQVDAVQKGIQPELMQATFGPPSFFTCPECHGSLWEISEDNHLIFRCHVGHAYTMENLLIDQNDALERALWAALRSLEENGALNRRLAERSIERGLASIAARFQERAEETEKHAKEIRTALRRTQALDQAELNEVA